ncbi:MAG: hypothetical protein AAFO86_09555 [Pseudomonadota bacterium]
MQLKPSKTALLIAAMATAVTLTSFGTASAQQPQWVSADAETVEVIQANFKFKVKKHHGFKKHGYKHHGFKHHGFKKKKHVSSRTKAKKLIIKKLF